MAGEDAGKVKTYGVAKSTGTCSMARLCKLVAARSAMSSADVKSVLDSLNWVMDFELSEGNTVKLGEFGSFHMTVSSYGEENRSDFTANNIKKAKIVFTPGSDLRKTKRDMSFTLDDEYEKWLEAAKEGNTDNSADGSGDQNGY